MWWNMCLSTISSLCKLASSMRIWLPCHDVITSRGNHQHKFHRKSLPRPVCYSRMPNKGIPLIYWNGKRVLYRLPNIMKSQYNVCKVPPCVAAIILMIYSYLILNTLSHMYRLILLCSISLPSLSILPLLTSRYVFYSFLFFTFACKSSPNDICQCFINLTIVTSFIENGRNL